MTNTGGLPDGDEARVWAGCVRHHRELADAAADRGGRTALEPLAAAPMNRTTTVRRLAEALEMAAEVDRPALGCRPA